PLTCGRNHGHRTSSLIDSWLVRIVVGKLDVVRCGDRLPHAKPTGTEQVKDKHGPLSFLVWNTKTGYVHSAPPLAGSAIDAALLELLLLPFVGSDRRQGKEQPRWDSLLTYDLCTRHPG